MKKMVYKTYKRMKKWIIENDNLYPPTYQLLHIGNRFKFTTVLGALASIFTTCMVLNVVITNMVIMFKHE